MMPCTEAGSMLLLPSASRRRARVASLLGSTPRRWIDTEVTVPPLRLTRSEYSVGGRLGGPPAGTGMGRGGGMSPPFRPIAPALPKDLSAVCTVLALWIG